MLGNFLNGFLLLVFGYAYPAFECFKIVEKNRVDIEQLKFWCKYWILVAFITVIVWITDVLFAWFPMYGEMKLAFFIYLWYPKTKGTNFVYDGIFRPFMSKHESKVDQKIMELRGRALAIFMHCWANCSEKGFAIFLEMFQYLAGQSAKFNRVVVANHVNHVRQKSNERGSNVPPPPSPNGLRSPAARNNSFKSSPLSRVNFIDSPRYSQEQPESPSKYEFDNDDESIPYSPSNSRLQQARHRLRRTDSQN